MSNITIFTDADVLCGRGGQAQKHVGNKTYRALVNLNKQLYASCRTTEKIKISRSIVAAIREQKGRFLEKQSGRETFYDIGDKKAVEKTSQALREGQPKLKKKMHASGEAPPSNLTAAATRTSLKEAAEGYQPPPALDFDNKVTSGGPGLSMADFSNMGLNNNGTQNEFHWEPPSQQQQQQQHQPQTTHHDPYHPVQGRPTMPPSANSNISMMSDISANFAAIMNDEGVRNTLSLDTDGSFKDAIKDIADPQNDIFYYGEEDDYAPMDPPPRRMMEARMDSFRNALMQIASPQNSSMSLTSNFGGSGGGGGNNNNSSGRQAMDEARANPADIVLPGHDVEPVDNYAFQGNRPDAIDDLISVGGLSKLSLMSGMSEATLDTGFQSGRRLVPGMSELTLDSAIQQRGPASRRNMHQHKGLSTRSAAMSEVSALDYLQEMENEDDDAGVVV